MKKKLLGIAGALAVVLAGCVQMNVAERGDGFVTLAHGFKPIAEEWWHFTLVNEPYPDTYFDFPVTDVAKGDTK